MLRRRKRMTPGERAEFYGHRKRSLTPPNGPAESLLLEVCESLIERNLKLAREGEKPRVGDR
jgi:hypothetical protein